MVKLLFLDFDGVLNYHGCGAKLKLKGFGSHTGVATDCVDRLNTIIKSVPDLEVVISSDWRKYYSLDRLNAILSYHGFKHSVIGVTREDKSDNRGNEIQLYIEENYGTTPCQFIVLDDNDWGISKMVNNMNTIAVINRAMTRGCEDSHGLFVQTDYTTGGLQDKHVQEVIDFFNSV